MRNWMLYRKEKENRKEEPAGIAGEKGIYQHSALLRKVAERGKKEPGKEERKDGGERAVPREDWKEGGTTVMSKR